MLPEAHIPSDEETLPTSGLGALNAAERAEYWAALALRHTKDLGTRSHKRLLTSFGSAYAAVHATKDWGEAKVHSEKARCLASGAWRKTAIHEWNLARHFQGVILLWTDPRYPEALRHIPDPPCMLYCQGDLTLLQNPTFAIVGTRRCSPEGLRVTTLIVQALAEAGITIVSGMALGIDRAAHAASVHTIGSTIAVLGAGHGVPYPKNNVDIYNEIKQHGLLISEYAPNTPPDTHNFPIRNRIISGLSLGVLVVEAAIKSGSLITARLALEQDRMVYAIPGAVGMQSALGCQELIRQGAQAVFASSDILRDLSSQLQAIINAPPRKTPVEAKPLPASPDLHAKDSSTIDNKHTSPKKTSQAEHVDSASKQVGSQTKQVGSPGKQQGQAIKLDQTHKPKALPTIADPTQKRILTTLHQESLDIDGLCQRLALAPHDVSASLVMLEIAGHIARQKNNTYTPTENA